MLRKDWVEKFPEISPWHRYNFARKALDQLNEKLPRIPKEYYSAFNVLAFESYIIAMPLASEFVRKRESALETA